MGFIDIKKEKTPKEKVQKVLDFLHQISYIDSVDDINIEDSVTDYVKISINKQIQIRERNANNQP